MKLICFRGGESTLKAQNQVQGQSDPVLSPTGEDQARAVRAVLEDLVDGSLYDVDAIYASDLQRAVQSAQRACHSGTIITDERLREADFGDAVGEQMDDYLDAHPELDLSNTGTFTTAFPGGESMADVYRRVTDCVDDIVAAHQPDDTAIVACHLMPMLALLGYVGKYHPETVMCDATVDHGEVIVLHVEPSGRADLRDRRTDVPDSF